MIIITSNIRFFVIFSNLDINVIQVPMDQPEAALDMYNRFVFNKPFYQ